MDKDDKRISESSALGRLMKSISDSYSSISNQLLLPLGLTLSQCEVLDYLYRFPPEGVETDRLLCYLKVARSSLSNTLSKLRKKGYIRYFNKGGDMRRKQITLTGKAMEIQEPVTRQMEYLESMLCGRLTDMEREAAYGILVKMLQGVTDCTQECCEKEKKNGQEDTL